LAGKSEEVIKQYFSALRQKQQDFFPFLNAVDKKFVCTPMDSGVDPLGPPSPSIKHVGAAYVDFMVRLIQSQQHAPRGCVCFFGLLAPCLSVSVCVLLRTGLCVYQKLAACGDLRVLMPFFCRRMDAVLRFPLLAPT